MDKDQYERKYSPFTRSEHQKSTNQTSDIRIQPSASSHPLRFSPIIKQRLSSLHFSPAQPFFLFNRIGAYQPQSPANGDQGKINSFIIISVHHIMINEISN